MQKPFIFFLFEELLIKVSERSERELALVVNKRVDWDSVADPERFDTDPNPKFF